METYAGVYPPLLFWLGVAGVYYVVNERLSGRNTVGGC